MTRRAQGLAVGLLTLAASSTSFAADDCTAWTLAGYRIGMSREDALAVRGGKIEHSGTVLRPQIEGGGKAVVEFNADGKIDQVSVRSNRPPPEIKLTVSWRVGQPSADGVQNQTRWESEVCATDLLMNAVAGGSGEAAQTDVFLVAHGTLPRAPRPKAPPDVAPQ